jgi:hypothetical protein
MTADREWVPLQGESFYSEPLPDNVGFNLGKP